MKRKLVYGILSLLLVINLAGCDDNNKPKEEDKNNDKNVNGTEIYEGYLTNIGIERIKTSEYTMPAFTLKITGMVDKTINSNSLRSVKLYDIVTYKTDAYKVNKDAKEVRYTGVRLIDVLAYLGVDKYSELELTDFEDGPITLPSSKMDESVFLVFYENGKLLGDGKINVVVPGFVDMFWGQGIKSMKIVK